MSAQIITFFIVLLAALLQVQADPVCRNLFLNQESVAKQATIRLTQNPLIFEKVFSQKNEVANSVSNAQISAALEQIFLKEMADKLDFLNPHDRYFQATEQVFQFIPKSEYQKRLKEGDLSPLAYYVNEITLDQEGKPLAKPILPYKIINTALREKTFSPSIQKQIDDLDRALTKIPNVQGIVYRGTRFESSMVTQILSNKINSLQFPAYTSTTTDLADATSFLARFLGDGHKDQIATLMILETKNGKPISMETQFAKEEEILIPRNAEFEIVRTFQAPPIREPDSPNILYIFLKQR